MDEGALVESTIMLFDLEPFLRAPLLAFMRIRAKKLGIVEMYEDLVRSYQEAEQKNDAQYARAMARGDAPVDIERDGNGRAIASIENFMRVMRGDPTFGDVRYNLLSCAPETIQDGALRRWDDTDDARARGYIEKVYRIHSMSKYEDAFKQLCSARAYHPIRDRIEAVAWDGVPRIERFLVRWAGCEDTAYTHEVSRLIFAGGIHRVYNPGCKFDDMPVLIGIKQGEGKTTLVRWLAMEDRFFREVTEFEGQKGMEALDGAWICEVGELLALTKAKEQEAIKSYLTRQVDAYRRPYDRRVTERARQCVFVGTTNKREFLSDMTGGRRFYPVVVNMSGYDLFDRKDEVQSDIAQCWAEAKVRMEAGDMASFADRTLIPDIRAMQAGAQEDDYRVGLIERYLDGRDTVCGIELWVEALKNDLQKPTRKDFADIGLIMQGFDAWERPAEKEQHGRYGRQRVWKRRQVEVNGEPFKVADDIPMFDDPKSLSELPKDWQIKLY